LLLKQHKGGVFPKGQISLSDIINDVMAGSDVKKGGAIFSFTGVVRESSTFTKKSVEKIIIESWDDKVFDEMDTICQELQNKHDLIDIRIWHATGEFFQSEILVFIVVASKHRKEGLLAIEEAINLYKTRVPIWKKEIYQDGSEEWISAKENV
jgi:molybdopterin synthase catalytic subunit